jgi:hypothetical protein
MAYPEDLQAAAEIAEALRDSGRNSSPTPVGVAGHDVKVYRSERQLLETVGEFLAQGLRAGQPLVVIATEAHRKVLVQGLRDRGLDTEKYLSGREATWLDARETLSAFMEGATPNQELFMRTVGSVFDRLINRRNYLVVRAYGEMVDLLWQDGNSEGALRLEAMWNELAREHHFGLLCAYSLDNFLSSNGAADLRRVCAHHTHSLQLE